MLTVMLIDDEYIILKGLEAMLAGQNEVALRVVPFLDSMQALSQLDAVRPEVIITDINMPELDGLTFIENALHSGYRGRFIIISGYEKLDYLKRAISLHVADYLIKPIDKLRLIDLLKQINYDRAEETQLLLFKFKLALTFSDELPDAAPLTREETWSKLLPNPCTALLATQNLTCAVGAEVQRQMERYFSQVHVIKHRTLSLFVLNPTQPVRASDIWTVWTESIAGDRPEAGVSSVHTTESLVEQLATHRNITLLTEAITDWVIRTLEPEQPLQSRFTPERLDYRFAEAVVRAQSAADLDMALNRLRETNPDLRDAFEQGFLETIAGEGAFTGYLPDPAALRELLQRKRLDAVNAQGLLTALWSLPNEFRALNADTHGPQYSEKIEQAVQYMKNHFTEDLSLRTVADKVGLSQNYFSTMFNHEVNVTFPEYLHKLRIEAACRLLENNPMLPVETVSARVGYQTVGHFFKIFKNTYGISPNRWRKK